MNFLDPGWGEVVDGLVHAGVFRTHAPRQIGGLEVDVLTYFELVELLSRVDASVGWLAMINCGWIFPGANPTLLLSFCIMTAAIPPCS